MDYFRRLLTFALSLFITMLAFAQQREITGTMIENDSREPLEYVTVSLLKTDSTFVGGAMTDSLGRFKVVAPENGRFVLRISSIGYIGLLKHIEMVNDANLEMGTIKMEADSKMLEQVNITGQALKVVLREDTFVYNSAAYRVPEGSVVEELVRRLPGAEVSDDGTITINGKTVKKIKVDGKEFMTGDTQTAMKNLPTSIIESIKVYDEKSDLSRITGIDDGNESTVLDFNIKRGMNKGFMANTDLAYGTHDRYAGRVFGGWMKDGFRVMLMGNANNTGNRGFGGRGGGGRGGTGLNSSKMGGVNLNYDNGNTLKIDGSIRWNHNDGDTRTTTSSENFVTTTGAFSNSLSQSYSRSDSWNGQMRFEWKPDSLTNIMFRPTFRYQTSDSRSGNSSASYNDNPYDYVDDPLMQTAINQMAEMGLMVNSRRNTSLSYSDTKRVGGSLQWNRKLSDMGRNVTLRVEANYNEGDSESLSTNNVHLYQVQDIFGNDSTYQTNRYNLTPQKSYNYTAQVTYSEPLWKATFLQFSYKFNYSYNKSDRSTYDFSNLGEDFFDGVSNGFRNWNGYLSRLAKPYTEYLDNSRSRYSEYKNYTHDIEMMFRMIRDSYNFNVGVLVQPQKSNFIQDYLGKYVDTVRTVVNVTPTLDFRYRFSKVSNLRVNYRGSTSQPSISQLLDITDDSDPLNISTGNPGLKPSFTQSLNLFYNGYRQHRQQAWMTFWRFNTTRNSISSMVTYDEKTGGRTTRPENINGDWSTEAGLMFNTSIDTVGVWSVNTFTNYRYNNYVGYVTLDRTSSSQKNTTRETSVSERLSASWRPTWGGWTPEFEIDGQGTYRHARNQLQSQGNQDIWEFSYGGSINVTTPWGTSLSMDLHERSRRGYSMESMNTNELIWNAQISHSFLKGKALVVSLQFYDLLHEQSTISRSLSAMQRSDTEYNSINSYALLHVIYRFNAFGGRNANRGNGGGDRQGPQEGVPGGRGGERPQGPPPGMQGGGRPPMGGPMM